MVWFASESTVAYVAPFTGNPEILGAPLPLWRAACGATLSGWAGRGPLRPVRWGRTFRLQCERGSGPVKPTWIDHCEAPCWPARFEWRFYGTLSEPISRHVEVLRCVDCRPFRTTPVFHPVSQLTRPWPSAPLPTEQGPLARSAGRTRGFAVDGIPPYWRQLLEANRWRPFPFPGKPNVV